MTKSELVKKLRHTSSSMMDAADALDFYGWSDEAVKNASELKDAAQVVAQWADELANETGG